nr:uncharacterized protein LOC111839474 [Paramormyrops kingsleyae]
MVYKILLSKPGGIAVLTEYEETGTICDSSRRQMVNILAVQMTESEGRIPQRITKEKYALGIITLFPALKDPFSKKGYEHFYDSQSGSGFLAWCIKTIQRKTKLPVKSSQPPVETTGGATLDRNIHHLQSSEESFQEAIALMNHISDRETILLKMRETFEYRQRLVHNPEAKVIKEAETLTCTPLIQRLLRSAKDQQGEQTVDYSAEWDSDMASLLFLLHILPPPSHGRKKMQRISACQAVDHVVMFHKSCRSLDEHLRMEGPRQPYLLASGTNKRAISSFYIVVDKKLVPYEGRTTLATFDELFKVHFVFGLKYDEQFLHFPPDNY